MLREQLCTLICAQHCVLSIAAAAAAAGGTS
jgi:hypothetical protein